MKICGKKLIAGAAAFAMALSMSSVFATGDEVTGNTVTGNTVSITKIEILNDGSTTAVAEYPANATGIKLTTEQLMRVTAVLTNGENNVAGEISFLSNIAGESVALDNNTIQYVDQQTYAASENETVQITFRPRTTIQENGIGTFVAKAGGTDVSSAASFTYSVEAPKRNMTFAATSSTNIQPGGTVSFTLKDGDANVESATVKATADETTYTATYADGVYTIKFDSAGTYTVTAAKDGYNAPTGITVNVVENTTVPDADKPKVTDDLKNGLSGVTQGGTEATLPDKAGEFSISYTVDAPYGKVEKVGNKLSLATGVFAAKVTVNASVGATISEQKVIYLVRDNTQNISFGNLGLISTDTGADAFASSTALKGANVNNTVKSEIKVEALNYALDRKAPDSAIQSAIDYDMNGDVTLSEYRMLKMMFAGDENFTADKLTQSRQSWIASANQN